MPASKRRHSRDEREKSGLRARSMPVLPKTKSDDLSHHLATLSRHRQQLQFTPPSPCPRLPALNPPSSSALRAPPTPAPRLPDTLSSPAPALVSPSVSPTPRHSQPLHPVIPPLAPTPAPERLSAAVMRLVPTTQLYLKGLGDLALLVYSVFLFSLLQLVLSHTLFPMLARKWGIRKAGKAGRFGEQGYAVVYTLSTTPPPRSSPARRTSGSTGVARVSFLVHTRVRASTGGSLARGMRMRGVCGPPVAHLPNRACS
ncbi:hypothetical protein B0H13DRAFT_1879863 [Mycena leptocephala]|nr:hypothetical protein B0H13DRAFT_1879863 [Mycena leptocephala]